MNGAAHLLDPEGRNPLLGKNVHLCKKARKMVEYMNPKRWRCPKCGRICEFASEDWRWNGSAWEHNHGWLVGYIPAERTNPNEDTHFPYPVVGPERPGV